MQYSTVQPGDLICYSFPHSCGVFHHYGIYCGDITYRNKHYKDVVIHYEGEYKKGQIRGLSLDKFAQNREIYILEYAEEDCYPPEIVVQRAMNILGESDYALFGNNCEHFASWCKTGSRHPQPGDRIYYVCHTLSYATHTHHGIYCGDITYRSRHYKDVVIHYEGKQKRGKISGLSYDKFAQNREVFLYVAKEICYPPETVIRRAINRLDETEYNFVWNNCEHFASWCQTGQSTSEQVDSLAKLGGVALGGATAFVLAPAIPAIVGFGVAATAAGGAGYFLGDLFE